jgi:CheY-like chemotaxis protein
VTQASNVNLREFVTDIRKRWGDIARGKGIEFRVDTSPSLPAIITLDRVSLDRVISNLIGNAVKFTDQGAVVLEISCTPERALQFVLLDDGPGLSGDALSRLFQYEGRPSDATKPGSGLGLYIAKELTGLLGASLAIENRESGGARALFSLPHEAWFDRSLRRSAKPQQATREDPVDLSGLNILLAEDNLTNQLVATQMLSAMGATFSVASDGLEAMALLETESFDLALLDIEMPRMSGLEVIKAVRNSPAPVGNLPLVALTAYVMREHRERIYGAGADGIIAKPLMSIEELGRSIRGYLKGTEGRTPPKPEPSSAQAPTIAGVIDREVFDALVETIGADSTSELLRKLLADTDTVAEGLGLAKTALDLAEIRSQTHILISVAGAIGATNLQYAAQRLNMAANRQGPEDLEDLCDGCLSGLAALQGFILEEQAKATVPA